MNDEFIESLTDKLEPVNRLRSPFYRFWPTLLLSLFYAALVVWGLGLRPDLAFKINDPDFIFELVLSGSTFVSALFFCMICAVPDLRGQKWVLSIPVTLFALIFLWLGLRAMFEETGHIHISGSHCIEDGILLGAVPAAILVYMIRRGATTTPWLSVGMIALAAGMLGWSALRLTCPLDHVGHILITHLLPFLIVGTALGLVGGRFLKW